VCRTRLSGVPGMIGLNATEFIDEDNRAGRVAKESEVDLRPR